MVTSYSLYPAFYPPADAILYVCPAKVVELTECSRWMRTSLILPDTAAHVTVCQFLRNCLGAYSSTIRTAYIIGS